MELQPSRHFLFLIDGTGLNAGKTRAHQSYSNVYNLNLGIETHNLDNSANIAFYFSGVGSSGSSSLGDHAAGIGLSDLIQQVYVNICSNFNEGDEISTADKIYIFGFSRGTFVAQAICRLINDYGLLSASRINHFNQMYRHWIGLYPKFKKELFIHHCCRKDVQIEFVGLFDSVFGFYNEDRDSPLLKMTMDKDKMLPSVVKACAHFLAIDENKSFFSPVPWEGISQPAQELIQIWMPGNHSDVGGGYYEDYLSSISLRRMLGVIAEKTSLKIDQERLNQLDDKIKIGDEQDNMRYVHEERRSARWWPLNSIRNKFSENRWERGRYIGKHFLDRSAKLLDGKFVMKDNALSQYTVPDELNPLDIF